MRFVPSEKQIVRGAKAITAARALDWDRIPEDWRKEHRRQAIAVLLAAMNEPDEAAAAAVELGVERGTLQLIASRRPAPPPAAAAHVPAPAADPAQIDLEDYLPAAPSPDPTEPDTLNRG